jgi:hypothetical protein
MATLNRETGMYEARKFFANTNEVVIGEAKDTGDKAKDKAAANAALKKNLKGHTIAYPPFFQGLGPIQIAKEISNGKLRKYKSTVAETGRQFTSPGFAPFRDKDGKMMYAYNPGRKISTFARADLAKILAAETKAENDRKTAEAAAAEKVETDGK